MEIIAFLVVGLIAGWLAGQVVKGYGFGLVGDMVVGIIGAFIGGYLFNSLGIATGYGMIGSIVTAFVGAVVLLAIIKMVRTAP